MCEKVEQKLMDDLKNGEYWMDMNIFGDVYVLNIWIDSLLTWLKKQDSYLRRIIRRLRRLEIGHVLPKFHCFKKVIDNL